MTQTRDGLSALFETTGRPRLEERLAELVSGLTLAAKVALLTGATAWRLQALTEIGLRSVVLSDGPVGVRGTGETAQTSMLFPSPSALAATWDARAAGRLGSLFAAEARRHGVDVVLAPQVNIQRTPVAGRHFECYSEDPLLTTVISAALITSMQAGGVAACLKHFVANDSETERTTCVAQVDERTLREVYLAPFEHAVRVVGVWSVMAAYNQVDDGVEQAPATEHRHLLQDVLKEEWGFDGVVVSDWLAARRTVQAAVGGLDLVMPGPGGPWGDSLLAAVQTGAVPEPVVDDKVLRVLRLAMRVGALDASGSFGPRGARATSGTALDRRGEPVAVEPGYLRDLAARSTVVLRDEGRRLPFAPEQVKHVALLGPNAVHAYVQGGGSAHVDPDHLVSPEAGLRTALPGARITVLRGGNARRHAPELDVRASCTDPRTGARGVRVSLLDGAGQELSTRVRPTWEGWARDLPDQVADVVVEGVLQLDAAGEHRLELGALGRWTFEVAGLVVARGGPAVGAEVILDSSINTPDGHGTSVLVSAPRPVELRATVQVVRNDGYGNQARAALRHRLPGEDADAEITAAAAAAAATAAAGGLVLVVVGTNDEVESEGWDRTSLRLPGRQDELVDRVLDAAPDAVVVVNAGAPVLLPWLKRARTVLWTWFPGQECGDALADVILGRTEPAGRLPWTLPARAEDVPVPHARPTDGVVSYAEGLHVGYRGWESSGAEPAAAFGSGLGWTTWLYQAVGSPEVDASGVTLPVELTNTGPRRGTEVVQVYLEAPHGEPERPVRWLGGFTPVLAAAGATVTATVRLPRRVFEVWDPACRHWSIPAGTYRARVGRSVRDLRLEAMVPLPHPPPAPTEGQDA